jgi:lipoprotein signal peptidase
VTRRPELAVAAVVLAADAVTKALAPRDWTFHVADGGTPWRMLFGCVLIAALFRATGMVAAGVLLGGMLGNTLWVILAGGAPNPFVVPVSGGLLAFNVADVAVTLGAIVTVTFWSVAVIRKRSVRAAWAALRLP